MFYFDEDHTENGFNEPIANGVEPSGATSPPAIAENHRKLTTGSTGIGGNGYKESGMAIFEDFYKLVNDDLGSGAYACVRTAISLQSGKEFAVKLVDKHEPGHTRSRINREIDIFKLCKGVPNIVQLIEWFEDDDMVYMVFEKMRGGPLLNRIQRKVCFTEQEASLVTRDIASALKFLHDRGIAHRDVKPENVLCTDLDRVSPVKLCDLDLASKPPSKSRSSGGGLHMVQSEPNLASPVGSAEFMAPEVVDAFVGDALKYDKRCDMWSLGVIIYIMLCGYPPFYGECERENCGWDQGKPCHDCQDNLFHRIQRGDFEFPEEEWANISEEAKDLISHLLVRNVRLRYTADDVLKHAWVKHDAPKTLLQTASNLFRNDSTRDIHQMNEHFNVINRITATTVMRLSTRLEGGVSGEEVADTSPSSSGNATVNVSPLVSPIPSPLMMIDSDGEEENRTPMPPPTPILPIDEISEKLKGLNTFPDNEDMTTNFLDNESGYGSQSQPQDSNPTTPLYMQNAQQSQFVFAPSHQQQPDYQPYYSQPQLVHGNNGMVYCAPPMMCNYPVMVNSQQLPPLNSQQQFYQQQLPNQQQVFVSNSQGQQPHYVQHNASAPPNSQHQYFYQPAQFYYYVAPPPVDMVNA